MTGQGAQHVFISYSSKDAAMARRITEFLEEHGYDVWIDQNRIEGGDRFKNKLKQGLKNVDAMVLLVSPDSQQSDWVSNEISFAQKRDIRIVPLLYRDVEDRFPLDHLQHIDFKHPGAEAFD